MPSNNIATTPLLKGLRVEGGTFYTFSSAMNDAILLFSTNNIMMNFSKFACLKLPNWQNTTTQRLYHNPNNIKSVNDTPSVDDANIFFPKAYFQNYIENFLSHIDANRNDVDFANFVEAAFWKALRSVSDADKNLSTTNDGAIQFQAAETYIDVYGQTRQKYVEIPASSSYEPVIKFVGDINMHNHKKHEGKEYMEVFAHIANSQGRHDNTKLVPNQFLTNQITVAQVPVTSGSVYVAGHETEYNTAPATAKTYAKAIYDTIDNKYNVSSDKDFLSLDWTSIEDPANTNTEQGNFDFNAILVYYDVAKSGDDATRRRNLYGILILDKMTTISPTTSKINSQKKFQPNENQAGNAFGFLFNLMFSSSTNQITSTITINDTAVIAMEMYMKALEKLQVTADKYEDFGRIILAQQSTITDLRAQMLGLSNRLVSDSSIQSLQQELANQQVQISQILAQLP